MMIEVLKKERSRWQQASNTEMLEDAPQVHCEAAKVKTGDLSAVFVPTLSPVMPAEIQLLYHC